jgi:hypothetical protein
MTDNFDLQEWMREQKQGPYTGANGTEKVIFKSSKPKSKTGLNEGLMGMMDLQAINSIMREEEMSEAMGLDISEKWDMIPMEEKEAILDSEDFSEEGLADYAYMGWKMIPDEVKELITDKVMKAKISEPEEDEDEKTSAMAMKQAKKGAKAVKGLNPTKDIHDLLYGDDEEDGDLY